MASLSSPQFQDGMQSYVKVTPIIKSPVPIYTESSYLIFLTIGSVPLVFVSITCTNLLWDMLGFAPPNLNWI